MNNSPQPTKPITVIEVVAPGCQHCIRIKQYLLERFKAAHPEVDVRILDVISPEGQGLAQKHLILASPGIIINGELFSTGGLDVEKFEKMIVSLEQVRKSQ